MQINRRPLGSSGLQITTVGFGAWAIGGGGWSYGWGPQDDKASEDTMRRAIELGVNWIDTAAIYGLGHSEQVVGRFVRSLPASERPFIFTKCGCPAAGTARFENGGGWPILRNSRFQSRSRHGLCRRPPAETRWKNCRCGRG